MAHPGRIVLAGRLSAAVLLSLGPAQLRADTIHMKDGGKIFDCRVVREDGDIVHVRTPGGPMGVPKAVIGRIEKGKSIFDTYDGMRSALNKDDAGGHFKLALWCRKAAGLREEARELLRRVIVLQTDHSEARWLLGYYRSGTEWKLAPPLSMAIDAKTSTANQATLREQLSILAKARQDFTIVSDLSGVSPPNGCELTIDLAIGNRSGTSFYGQRVSGPTVGSSVTLKPVAVWLGTKPEKLVLKGEVSASVPRARDKAIIDAFTRSSTELHDFLDGIIQARMKQFDPPGEAKAPASKKPAPKNAAPKAMR